MIEQGIVNKIDGKNIQVMMRKEVACCGQKCTDDSGSCNIETYTFDAENINNLKLEKGQKIEVSIPTGSTLRGLLLVFVIPFGLFFTLYGLAPGWGLEGGIRMAVSFAALAGSLLLGKLLSPKESKKPVIQRLL